MNQLKVTATAPARACTFLIDGEPLEVVSKFIVVDSTAFAEAHPAGLETVVGYVRTAIELAGGDPDRIVWSAEPVGPQLRLVPTDGIRR